MERLSRSGILIARVLMLPGRSVELVTGMALIPGNGAVLTAARQPQP